MTHVFTLSGTHIFPIYDGCRELGIDLVDVRHESAAAFAAEGWAKVTRSPGVAAVTAGPGVTNALSAIASAKLNHTPMVVLAGRAPARTWGRGALQEIDHVAFVRPIAKAAATAASAEAFGDVVDWALATAVEPPGGPVFVDFPVDYAFDELPDDPLAASDPVASPAALPAAEPDALARAVELLDGARRPAIMAGTDLYWAGAERELRELAERLRLPVFLNGQARGCVPADHPLCFSRARRSGLRDADVVVLVGTPLDFRLGFGAAFADGAQLIVVDRAAPERELPRRAGAALYGDVGATLRLLAEASVGAGRDEWLGALRAAEATGRSRERPELTDERAPLHPARVYGELRSLLDRDAIIVGDGGDFVSYAGRFVDSYEPGCWLDPGPYGCLGCGPGYALAAKLAHPERQVVLLLGDGAFGFSGLEFDTLARHRVGVVAIVGNNGIWALEKHPMEAMFGYSVVATLAPQTRYDETVASLGAYGAHVTTPAELRPALERALAAGGPALVNVETDPDVVYPRKLNLIG